MPGRSGGGGGTVDSGRILGDRYELTEKVGSGSAGSVWRAIDRVFGRVVAVKVLRPDLTHDESAVRRFATEARVMARLHHAGIAGVYDFGQDRDGTMYLVMTFVEGEPLRRLVAPGRPLPPERVMTLVTQAADALRVAHRAGVVHRDVKPVNLIVRADGTVVLTDFGIARVAGNDLTGPGLVVGTASYLAPEQAAGQEVSPAADVYALGVTAYECLTGRPPFAGGTPMEVARRHVTDVPAPLPASLPKPVRDLVGRMLAKDPQRRPTAAAVAAAARAAAAPRAPAPAADPGRRRPVLVGAVAGAAVVSAVFAMVAFAPGGRPAGRPVADVVDATESEALAVLQARGFVVDIVPRAGPRCLVVAQHPTAGQVRPPGTRVTITVERDGNCAATGGGGSRS